MEKKEYTVKRIDGDYAFLVLTDGSNEEEKCVARALLPAEIAEDTKLSYECFTYSISREF